MSIKPIDYNVMLPKTQELSSAKHIENVKNRNIVESGFVQQEKNIKKRKTKVMDTEKTNKSRIADKNSSKKQETSQNKSKKRPKESSKEDISVKVKGNNIDIRI